MEKLSGIVIIAGNYGSGKTEVAINLAVTKKRAGFDVCIADLDLVNPYFRTREAKKALAGLGIDVIVPPDKYLQADLPILTPAVSGLIRKNSGLTLIDAGGDGVGATVLAALADSLKKKQVEMFQVVNPFRPFTETVSGCMKICEKIENASNLSITGIIGNANLIDETCVEDIYKGYYFMKELSEESGLPIIFITVPVELLPQLDIKRFAVSVLPIERQLVPPWKKAVKLTDK